MAFPIYRQLNAMDCGPTALRMVAMYYGKHYTTETLRQKAGFSKQGSSMLGLSDTAEEIGFRTKGVKISYQQLCQVTLPCIVHWDQNHFVVVVSAGEARVKVADPAKGMVSYSVDEFLSYWISSESSMGEAAGLTMVLEPTAAFYEAEGEKDRKIGFSVLFKYLGRNKFNIAKVFIVLLFSSFLQLLAPFLTQSMVDLGINQQNLKYVQIVLIAQAMLIASQNFSGFIKDRLLLRISNMLNLNILSDFWFKLMKLPVSYFDIHPAGDTLQRISDHQTVRNFLTGTALNMVFSIFNFVVYAVVLIMYDIKLFIFFGIGSIIYFIWIGFFFRLRRKINQATFGLSAKENSASLQLIYGMQEIRLNNAEKQKRWEWEDIQASLFKLNLKSLNYGQLQSAGATLINQLQNLIITFTVARFVIDGHLTLGAMLSVQYIIGQLNAPISTWVAFAQNAQDAKISLERLNEIHELPDEKIEEKKYDVDLPTDKGVYFRDFCFAYPGTNGARVLDGINLDIPQGKVTAIVGVSGSGKTTLLKILLKVYEQYVGGVYIGEPPHKGVIDLRERSFTPFDRIDHAFWREKCGAVLQDGYIFNDTIARNIALGHEVIDYEKLNNSCRTANIDAFIRQLPNGLETLIGSEGIGLSMGQKQRILIARAVYKNPEYIFFDEATNSLDANNEREIIENLNAFLSGKTVVIVAHRLSTVKNADNIVVLENGKIVEQGTHQYLQSIKGKYYELVKNQLELGN